MGANIWNCIDTLLQHSLDNLKTKENIGEKIQFLKQFRHLNNELNTAKCLFKCGHFPLALWWEMKTLIPTKLELASLSTDYKGRTVLCKWTKRKEKQAWRWTDTWAVSNRVTNFNLTVHRSWLFPDATCCYVSVCGVGKMTITCRQGRLDALVPHLNMGIVIHNYTRLLWSTEVGV